MTHAFQDTLIWGLLTSLILLSMWAIIDTILYYRKRDRQDRVASFRMDCRYVEEVMYI